MKSRVVSPSSTGRGGEGGVTKRNHRFQGLFSGGTSEPIMATLGGSRGDRHGNSNQHKSSLVSPEKVRDILNEGVSSTGTGANRCVIVDDAFDLKGPKNKFT